MSKQHPQTTAKCPACGAPQREDCLQGFRGTSDQPCMNLHPSARQRIERFGAPDVTREELDDCYGR